MCLQHRAKIAVHFYSPLVFSCLLLFLHNLCFDRDSSSPHTRSLALTNSGTLWLDKHPSLACGSQWLTSKVQWWLSTRVKLTQAQMSLPERRQFSKFKPLFGLVLKIELLLLAKHNGQTCFENWRKQADKLPLVQVFSMFLENLWTEEKIIC